MRTLIQLAHEAFIGRHELQSFTLGKGQIQAIVGGMVYLRGKLDRRQPDRQHFPKLQIRSLDHQSGKPCLRQ